ncbi:MAG: carboxylating nicotinate-nucleotide diphosphorylase [Candidatus Omnitrophota bacterium]
MRKIKELAKKDIFEAVGRALKEDIGGSDITTRAVFRVPLKVQAVITAKDPGILAGMAATMAAFAFLDPAVKCMFLLSDGQAFKANTKIAFLEGDIHPILSAERTALNFLSHLSGIATLTSKFVKKVKSGKTKIMDTRKTTPGLRALEKYAVSVGGGHNHRMGLYDQVLVKDNHLRAVHSQWSIVHSVIENAGKNGVKTEIEVSNLEEFKQALKCRPDIIMLDNMNLTQIKSAVKLRNFLSTVNRQLSTKLEVSGGVDLNNVGKIAATGVDMISVGAITHSARPIDFSLEVV